MYVFNPEKEFPIEWVYQGKTKAETAVQVMDRDIELEVKTFEDLINEKLNPEGSALEVK